MPSDAQLLTERGQEAGSAGSGIFDIAAPPAGTMLRPVERIPRDKFGVVGPFPLQLQDLPAVIFPDATLDDRQSERLTRGNSAVSRAGPRGPAGGNRVPEAALSVARS